MVINSRKLSESNHFALRISPYHFDITRFGDETVAPGFQDAVHFRDGPILFRQDGEQPRSENDIEFCVGVRKLESVDSSKAAISQP